MMKLVLSICSTVRRRYNYQIIKQGMLPSNCETLLCCNSQILTEASHQTPSLTLILSWNVYIRVLKESTQTFLNIYTVGDVFSSVKFFFVAQKYSVV